jgi:hypothetical protein
VDRFDPKQPGESYYVGFDFAADFTDEDGALYDSVDTVDSITVVDNADSSDDQTAAMVDADKTRISGNLVMVWVQGGESGKTYKITVTVSGAILGEVFELEALLPVEAI